MSTILAAERERYTDVWTSLEHYRDHAPGELYLPVFLSLVKSDANPLGWTRTVVDAGTGSGKGALALREASFKVRTCDVTDAGLIEEAKALPFYHACLWHDLSHVTAGFGHVGRVRADYVYCTDVLEHLPPQFTMLAIDQMLRVTSRALFLSVSLVPDNFGIWVGSVLHQTVEPFIWWRDAIGELGTIEDARDLINSATFFVRPR